MAKVATKYLKEDPYQIIEEGLHVDKTKVSESLFSLANEYHGIRGFFDEGGSLPSLQGSYFNGIYEYSLKDTPNAYRGIVKRTHFMINSVNWVKARFSYQDVILDLGKCKYREFMRTLDMKSGVMERKFVWEVNGVDIHFSFKRMLSMLNCERAFQVIEITASKDIVLDIEMSLDSNVLHWEQDCYYQRHDERIIDQSTYLLEVETLTTKQKVVSAMKIDGDFEEITPYQKDKEVGFHATLSLKSNHPSSIYRYVVNVIDKKGELSFDDLATKALTTCLLSSQEGFKQQLESNREYWTDFFAKHDIVIEGDMANQQGIRFCLFQLQQTYHGLDASNNIGAKGLTGEAYSGHTFWDTETYCLSYYLLNNINAGRNLLLYRYHTLAEAKKRAEMLDCEGACYPIATLNGEEACNLWQHASLQFQPSTGVAYAIYHYYQISHDEQFLKDYGYEMLVEISKFLLSRGSYNSDHSGFGFYCVMGPDEFQMMVNNNTYTNYMAKRTFEYTLEVHHKYQSREILKKCGIDESFFKKIEEAAQKMIILYDEKTHLFEQHEGYFHLPHINIHDIPVEDFPLYSHWSYDRIYRNDMIKQPDVLMFLYLFNQSFSLEQKKANYEFYEPRCIHESSLSPSIHSILAAELGKIDEALDFFGFATRLDLDDYNRNTHEGLHTTSISAAWLNIVYGFGGVRTDGDILKIAPVIPYKWKSYSFKINYQGVNIKVEVYHDKMTVIADGNRSIKVKIYDSLVEISSQPVVIKHE